MTFLRQTLWTFSHLAQGKLTFYWILLAFSRKFREMWTVFLFRIISTGDSDCGNIRERGEGVGVSMLYHRIARDSSFCKKLYPCASIVRLVIFVYHLTLILSHVRTNYPTFWIKRFEILFLSLKVYIWAYQTRQCHKIMWLLRFPLLALTFSTIVCLTDQGGEENAKIVKFISFYPS